MQDGSSVVEHDNDSPTSEVRCCEKNNPPSSMVVGIDEGSKSSDHLENEYEIQNVEPFTQALTRAWLYVTIIDINTIILQYYPVDPGSSVGTS